MQRGQGSPARTPRSGMLLEVCYEMLWKKTLELVGIGTTLVG